MKKFSFIIICLFVFSVLSVDAKAALIPSYEFTQDTPGGPLTTIYSWATVDTFDLDRPGWGYSGNGIIYNGPQPSKAAPPYNPDYMTSADSTNYYAVPQFDSANLSVIVDFGGAKYNYLGLFWGSMDEYNKIDFFTSSGDTVTIWGSDVSLDGADGNQQDADTEYKGFRESSFKDRV